MAPKEPNDFFFKKGFFLIKKKWIKMENVKCGQSNQSLNMYLKLQGVGDTAKERMPYC